MLDEITPRGEAARCGQSWTVFIGHDWGHHTSSSQQLALALAERGPVLWVNSVGMRLPRLNWSDARQVWRKLHTPRLAQVRPSIVAASLRVLPYHQWAPARRYNRRVIRKAAELWRTTFRIEQPHVVCCIPTAVDLAEQLRPSKLVYYCQDDFATLPGVNWPMIEPYERALVERADLVLVSSPQLLEVPRLGSPKARLFRHGVDYELFSRAATLRRERVPEEVHHLPGPVVGYFGTIDERIDLGLIEQVARVAGTVLLVGKAMVPTNQLQRRPNVLHLNRYVNYEDVHRYLAACDVLIAPYQVGPHTRSLEPLKLREYLATGKPIVATALPAFVGYASVVRVASNPNEFAQAVSELAERPAASQAERMRAAQAESWHAKADELQTLLRAPEPAPKNSHQNGSISALVGQRQARNGEFKALRLGFVSPAFGALDDGLWTTPGTGRLLDELARRCGQITVALSIVASRPQHLAHRVQLNGGVQLIPLPHIPSIAQGFTMGRACRSAIRQVEASSDLVIVQMAFSPPTALLHPKKPRLYHVCGDVVQVVRASRYYRGSRRLAAVAAARALDRVQAWLFRGQQSRVVTNGSDLYQHYGRPPGRAVVSSCLFEREIGSVQRRRPKNAPPRILFVGYLRPEKGTETLLEAFLLVRKQLPNAELHVVGDQDLKESGAAADLIDQIRHLPSNSVVLHGQVEFGPSLFQMYADADVLVLPSRSEGTPRVLIEARAFGCPVVASRVGGIPSSVEDGVNGLLVPPDDPVALAQAVLRILNDHALRSHLIQEGLEFARERTVERYVDELLSEAAELLPREVRNA